MVTKRTTKTKAEAATRAVAYLRVSTDVQASEGVSLDAQAERLRAYCTLRGLELVEVVTDAGVSGGVPMAERAGGARVLSLVSSGAVRHVVAVKLDRLFRDTVDCLATVATWDRSGVALHLTDMGGASLDTSSAMGRMFLTVCAGFAELERGLVGERTSAAMAQKARAGEFTGGHVPFGFVLDADGVTLRPDATEQACIARARELSAAGLSLRVVASRLSGEGFRTRRGGAFHAQQVSNMVGPR